MNLDKLSNDAKLSLCKKYFFVGFALLPFVWAVNAVWFFREAFLRPPFPQQRTLKTYVVGSVIGALVALGALIAWVIFFKTRRLEWGALGDSMSFVMPKGVP